MNFRPLTESYAEAVAIPTKIAPISTPSKAIERLLTKREREHNSVINFIKISCQQYNSEIEEEIEEESDNLKENLEKMKTQIGEFSKRIFDIEEEEKFVNLDVTEFQNVQDKVQNCNKERLQAIDSFYENVRKLEKKRSTFFKNILKEAYKKCDKISHLLPFELLHYFESEILRLNEITMDNYRSYTKIQTDLKLQIQEEIRLFLLQMSETKEKHKMATKMAKLKRLMKDHKGPLSDSAFPDLQLSDLQFTAELPRSAPDVDVWARKMKTTLDDLDTNAKKLINLYKMAVVQIFNRFFDELRTLTEAVMDESQCSQTLFVTDEPSSEIYRTILDDLTQTYTGGVAELQDLWNSITKYMESNIKNTNTFLISSAHLWDNHFSRVEDIETIFLQDLDFLVEKHNRIGQNIDKKINTTLDKLREESTVAKLNEHLKVANKFLDSIKKLYSSQCDEEIKLMRKYWGLIDQAIDLLISELDRFLEENSKSEVIKEKRSFWSNVVIEDDEDEEIVEDANEKFIPHQMKVCRFQVDAVNNWMFGLWEAIKHYMINCRKEVTGRAQQWAEWITLKLKKRLEIRLATHQPRYLRIKTMIHDVRLKELEDHLNDFRLVEEKTKQFLSDSSNFIQLSKENSFLIIENYERTMREIEEKLKKASRSQHVASCIERSKVAGWETKQKLENNFNARDELGENRGDVNKIICHFSSSIKLFVDGGNYSRAEAKLFKKKIEKLRKTLPKKFKKVSGDYEKIKIDILTKFGHSEKVILDRLELSKKEFEHNERICCKIGDLRSKIRNLAYEMKFDIHRVDSCIDYYSDLSTMEIWKYKHFEIMKEAVQECLDRITKLSESLIKRNDEDDGYLKKQMQLIEESFKEIEETSKVDALYPNIKKKLEVSI